MGVCCKTVRRRRQPSPYRELVRSETREVKLEDVTKKLKKFGTLVQFLVAPREEGWDEN